MIQGGQLPQSQLVKDLTELFNIFDKNGDGKISQGELESVLQSLGENPTVVELDKMVKEVDADGDGYIDLQEFIYLNTVALKNASGLDINLVDCRRASPSLVWTWRRESHPRRVQGNDQIC
jgi:hypothetical protein